MIKTRKSLLEQIADGIVAGGLLGTLMFGMNSCTESSRVQKYLVERNYIAAQQSYNQKETYKLAAKGGFMITAVGIMLSCYNLNRNNKRKENGN